MTTRIYTQKDGTVWEWEETKELSQYIKEIHQKNVTDITGRRQSTSEESKAS